jgi:ribose/xylose/arabinose/galactoside ABC-type transport system permease subunit
MKSRRLVPRELSTVFVLTFVYAVFAAFAPQMLNARTITTILQQIAPVAIAGVAITLVMVSGALDLSVGGTIALSGVVAAALAAHSWPVWFALLAGVLVGSAVGLVNAGLVVGLKLNSVIATLGTLYAARGVSFLLSDGRAQNFIPDAEGFSWAGNGATFSIPNPVWIMLVVVAIFFVLQTFTVIGRYSVAIGSNERAATLSGIRVGRTRVILFVLAGLAAGVAGVMVAGQFNGDPKVIEEGWEFSVIVAAVLGGTSLSGGKGLVLGTVVGAAIVGVMSSGLNIMGIDRFWQYVVQGMVLVLAVTIDDRIGALRPLWGSRTPASVRTDEPEVHASDVLPGAR